MTSPVNPGYCEIVLRLCAYVRARVCVRVHSLAPFRAAFAGETITSPEPNLEKGEASAPLFIGGFVASRRVASRRVASSPQSLALIRSHPAPLCPSPSLGSVKQRATHVGLTCDSSGKWRALISRSASSLWNSIASPCRKKSLISYL